MYYMSNRRLKNLKSTIADHFFLFPSLPQRHPLSRKEGEVSIADNKNGSVLGYNAIL